MGDGARKPFLELLTGGRAAAPAAAGDLDLSTLHSEKLKSGYAYWRGRCSERLPSRAMIDPIDIPPLLPHIVLHGVERQPLDFVYRLIGSEVRRHMAEDRTGQRMSAIAGQRPPSRIWSNLARIV